MNANAVGIYEITIDGQTKTFLNKLFPVYFWNIINKNNYYFDNSDISFIPIPKTTEFESIFSDSNVYENIFTNYNGIKDKILALDSVKNINNSNNEYSFNLEVENTKEYIAGLIFVTNNNKQYIVSVVKFDSPLTVDNIIIVKYTTKIEFDNQITTNEYSKYVFTQKETATPLQYEIKPDVFAHITLTANIGSRFNFNGNNSNNDIFLEKYNKIVDGSYLVGGSVFKEIKNSEILYDINITNIVKQLTENSFLSIDFLLDEPFIVKESDIGKLLKIFSIDIELKTGWTKKQLEDEFEILDRDFR